MTSAILHHRALQRQCAELRQITDAGFEAADRLRAVLRRVLGSQSAQFPLHMRAPLD
jgi:hypothetical protein